MQTFGLLPFSLTIGNYSDQLLSEETVGSGLYCPYVNDPDFANAQNTALWELSLLSQHYCAPVKSSSHTISQLKYLSEPLSFQSLTQSMDIEDQKCSKLERGELRLRKKVRGSLRYPEKVLKLDDVDDNK